MANEEPLRTAADAAIATPPASVDRIAALDALLHLVESTLRREVTQARDSGVTWAAIGARLGVTRQAAFQRFGARGSTTNGGRSMTEQTLLIEAPERTKDIVRAIAESRTDDLAATFTPAAADALPPERLAEAWSGLTTSFGRWEDFGGSSAVVAGEYVVGDVRLEFEAGAVTCRTSWDAEGRLAGLFFLPVAE